MREYIDTLALARTCEMDASPRPLPHPKLESGSANGTSKTSTALESTFWSPVSRLRIYNVAHRNDDAFIDDLAPRGIAYVPFFPLGGFTPLQSTTLDSSAALLKATPMQVALAWLLLRSPNILLIPGTSSVAHLRENLKAVTLQLPAEVLADLDAIDRTGT